MREGDRQGKKHGGGGGELPKKLGRGVQPASQNPYPFMTKIFDFPYPINDLTKHSSVYSVWSTSKTTGARRVTGAREKLLQHVHSCRKHDEEVACSKKKMNSKQECKN